MTEQVKVKVRPGEAVRFPAICVHCGEETGETIPLRRRKGRVLRQVEAPLCSECRQWLGKLSGREERWHRLSWLAAGVVGVIAFGLLVLALPGLFRSWGLLLALLLAAIPAVATFSLMRRHSLNYARPEKKAVLEAAQMADFSWRTTTFTFTNDQVAERFRVLNSPDLMEI